MTHNRMNTIKRVNIKITAFWGVTWCNQVEKHLCFRETYCIHVMFEYSLLGCDAMQNFEIICHLKAMVKHQCLLPFNG